MKPEIGVCYYPEHWPESDWADDAKRMVQTGISWVRIGEFAWSRLEASEGQFTWEWLDRAVDILASHGLKIVMGTPSATPPKWVLKKYPDMLAVDSNGRARKFGSRRHYCFSHLAYRSEAARMAKAMAKRYGAHPAVQAWQIDNEYGCHETAMSFSNAALRGFQEWLAQKYQSPKALNRAWGNVFWSMEYEDFADIALPNQTVTEANPAHWLDFRRFTSEQVVAFNRAQVEAMRPYSDAPFIHNYMGRVLDFDHFAVGEDLEIASWDSYPLGFLECFIDEESNEWKSAFCRQGDPDFQAFHHDLYRAIGKGRWWIMEQQPGPVNWAPYNPIPLEGMVKLWGMEAFAHGAEVVSYFRWRQAPFAQEQMHAGLLRPDGANAQAQKEVSALAAELAALGALKTTDADVAIIFDYESQWAAEIQPQGQSFDYFRLVFEQYRALRKLGLSVDFLPANVDNFGARKLVLIPGLLHWNDALHTAIKTFDGCVLAGPRTGLKSDRMQIPLPLGPGFAGALTARVATLRPDVVIPLKGKGHIKNWYEELETTTPFLQDQNNAPIVSRDKKHFYLGAWLDGPGMAGLLAQICEAAGIETEPMEGALRKRTCGKRTFIVNYASEAAMYHAHKIKGASYKWI